MSTIENVRTFSSAQRRRESTHRVDQHNRQVWDEIFDKISVRGDLAGWDRRRRISVSAFPATVRSSRPRSTVDPQTHRKPQVVEEAYRDMLRNVRARQEQQLGRRDAQFGADVRAVQEILRRMELTSTGLW
jgi:hypothetical protein